MRSVIVIPTYQEVENIELLLRNIRSILPAVHVLIVDDGSPDGTARVAEGLEPELKHISVMRRTVRDGLGRAYIAGFRWALERDYEIVMGMDADLSHDPAALPSLIAAIGAGADLVIGSRYIAGGSIPNWPAHRRALSSWGNRYGTRLLGLHIHDATSGFRAYRSTSLAKIDLDGVRSSGYCFLIELVYRTARLGGKISEVPITFVDRERGSSKMNGRVMVESLALVTLWGLRDRLRGLARRARHA